jgi:hypothetical protein
MQPIQIGHHHIDNHVRHDPPPQHTTAVAVLSQLAPGSEVLQLLRWQDDTVGSFGRPQSLITDQIGDYDVLVAMMWRRFGTPTGKADSEALPTWLITLSGVRRGDATNE